MQIESLGDLPYCKGLWSVISGTTCRCEKDLVIHEINNATNLLKNGLNFYKKFTGETLKKFELTNPPARMFDLISKLAPLLNIDATIAWELTVNYMFYEYRHSAETFAAQLADSTSIKQIIDEIWNFYYSERITMIKCLKLMIEYKDNSSHPYNNEFKTFFEKNTFDNLLQSSLEQIDCLKFTNTNNRCHLLTDEHLHKLYNNSLIEMRELLHIITMIIDTTKLDNFEKIYGSICGEPRRLSSSKNHEDKKKISHKLEEIRQCQSALFIVIFDIKKQCDNNKNDFDKIEKSIRNIRTSMQDILEHKCLRDSSIEDGPLLLSWMVVNFAIEAENSEQLNFYRPFGMKAVQLDVFNTLKKLLDSEMLRSNTRYSQVVQKSIYNLISLLCSFIDVDKISEFNGVFEAISSVLRSSDIAADFWNDKSEENGLWPFFHRAVFLFPYRFEPLTIISTGLALASTSSAKKIVKKLENLNSITLKVPKNCHLNITKNNTTNTAIYRPYEMDCKLHHNTFGIPDDCPKIILDNDANDDEIVLWKIRARYGDAFHHKIEQLFIHSGSGLNNIDDYQKILIENITKGFGLIDAILDANVDIPQSMIIPTDYLCLEIINRFSYPVLPRSLYNIVSSCFKITSRLVLHYPDEIFSKMRVGVYPKFNNFYQDTKELARAVSFDGGLIGSWLSGIETIEHKYPILNAYLDTLLNYLLVKHNIEMMENVEIPGMVFILQGVLPKLDSWYFSSESERIDIWLKSMFCIHRVLDVNLLNNEPRKKLQLVVAYSLLYLEPRHALLKLIRTGEKNLRTKMMNEIDWISGKGFKIIKSVQLALSLVNRLLMFRNNLGLTHDERSPLEIALYTSPSLPNALLIVPTIVDYLYVEFSPSLQAMAVRLLKKFAHGFSMSLLVCMGMDGTKIRGTFASRLMSPTCSVEVKVAILELVAVCLERQPGLTEALFNIMHKAEQNRIFPRPPDQFLTEGCSQFLILYLKRIYNEKKIVEDRLYDNTMNLLRSMWYNRNVILVNYFRKRENYWTQVFSPLFRSLVKGSRGYAHLIDIITLELFESSSLTSTENDFTKNLEKLLLNDNHWDNIIEYILKNVPQQIENSINRLDINNDKKNDDNDNNNMSIEAPLYEANIEAWYHFIVTLTDPKISNELMNKMAPAKIQLMTKLTLESLSSRIKCTKNINDARITMLLASLALRIVTSWQLKCIDNPTNFVSIIVQLMEDVFHSYSSYGIFLRRILVSLVLGCIQLVKDAISNDRGNLEYLIVHSCLLSNIELRKLRETVKKNQKIGIKNDTEDEQDVLEGKSMNSLKSYQECTPATLTICMVTQLLRCSNNNNSNKFGNRSACLHLRQMVPELMNCLNETIQHHEYASFSRASLEFLGTIARLPYYNPSPRPIDDEESIAKLWLGLIPPTSLGNSILASLYDDSTYNGNWRCQDWWKIYTLGLEFLTGLVTTGFSSNQPTTPPTHLTPIILFLGSHEHQLTEIATLLRHTADLLACDLVQSLVGLISALTTQPQVWDFIQPSVREGLMKCMYLIYDSTVNLLLRPRILKFIIDGVTVESAEDLHFCDEKLPSNELKLLVNKLIIVNWWCAQCFVRFSPRLNALVDTIYTQNFWHTPLAEMNFGPPQMSMCSGPSLTFGTIISSTQLFTQALNAHLTIDSTTSTSSSTTTIASSITSMTTPTKNNNMDSAKREWERATPDNPRKINPKDLRTIFNIGRPLNSELSSFISGPEVLGNPRLLRRPYDPLICENTILSKATPFVGHHTNRQCGGGAAAGTGNTGGTGGGNQTITYNKNERIDTNPWFSTMDKNNSRLALEINLILVLCQTLEGIKSPRLALRDRQLIVRETANEITVFFDFLEQKTTVLNDWNIEGTLINDTSITTVKPIDKNYLNLRARLNNDSTIDKVPVGTIDHNPGDIIRRDDLSAKKETRLNDSPITTGCFDIPQKPIKFLSLVAKTFKSTLESLDSSQFE
ncbi:hypothetical protein HCN44_010089 [Aphidius gifuensis]|uniref:Nucleoporin Nup188 N-terminal domain-containing protein n=1 Tax=Aphidius gifuensis TaxID=684658 RepID=A0A835CR17_APHGI|nr:nucleoporin Nup188 [Aphidius gifuensis]KAF7993494.1 hypothetical protein HCN44_010089 [Aphidius gifuensis]